MTPGTRIGPYEVTALIGAGGMGEVCRARDTKLNRDVALKVLPAAFAGDPERMARFQREAQLLAALNHPSIAAIYGLEEAEGHRAIVMELVEGSELRGPLPVDEVLRVAKQIADAVEYAHDRGVIHRDLKPANIKVTPDGSVKVLDFGLAKALDDAGNSGIQLHGSMSPTLSLGATHAGVILGTAAYMAPEQAKGKAVDRRADIWAFGVVLYEMLTGAPMFGGDTVAETLASVMKDAPTFGKLPNETPRAIRKLVSRCLERDVRRRLQSIGEARIVIEDVLAGAGSEEQPVQTAALAKPASKLPWAVAAVLFAALGTLAWAWYPRPPVPNAGVVRFTMLPPESVRLTGLGPNASQQAVSPDGHFVAFVADEPGGRQTLWIRPLESLTAQQLDRTDGASFPFWSPDSQFIAFFQDGQLRRVPVSGGSPLTICDASAGQGGSWNRDGVIVFAPLADGPLHRVPATGGVSAPVTRLDQGEERHTWPWFLPDGQRFLYFARGNTPDTSGLYVQTLGSTERTFVMPTQGRGAVTGRAAETHGILVFMREGTVLAQGLDLDTLQLMGEPVTVADDVRTGGINGRNAFSVSTNGVMAYRAGRFVDQQLTWYTRNGQPDGSALRPGAYTQIELSPDGKKVAVGVRVNAGLNDLWLLDLATGVFSRLAGGAGNEADPVWSPDSRRLIYMSSTGDVGIRETVVGSGSETSIFADGKQNYPSDWSHDGKTLLFNGTNGIFTLLLDGERKPQPVLQTPFNEDQLRISPDGHWVSYNSNESGQSNVYVAAFPSFNDRRQVSTDGGLMPFWRSDGRELFYVTREGTFMAMDVHAGTTLDLGLPKPLFRTTMLLSNGVHLYAVSGDGQRFLVAEPVPNSAVEPLHIILNWPTALGQ